MPVQHRGSAEGDQAGGAALAGQGDRREADLLFEDLGQRLAAGPVRFDLVAQMAAPGDPTDDATTLWPPERERIALGAIEVTGARADQSEERSLFFNPNNLPDGITQFDDPLLPARQQSYGVAGARRSAD